MYVDILILSHLLTEPVHGYELKRKVTRTTAFALHNNSLYPALRRFEEAGAVSRTAEHQEGRPPRHVYALTDLGRELLHDMLADLPPELANNDEEFLTRLGLFDMLTPDERRGVLSARMDALSTHISHLEGLGARATNSKSGLHEWGSVVVAGLIDRAASEQAWLERLMKRVDT